MSFKNRIFKIDTDFGPITFQKRDIGSKGRDILAIKVALGSVVNTPLQNSDPFQENTIGKSWFDCTTGEAVTTLESIEFDESLQRALMTFQVNHQYSIFAYYFEKFFARRISTKNELLEAISSCLTLVRVETGIFAEATAAILHGWRYNSIFENKAFVNFGEGIVEEITAEILELVQGESAIMNVSIGEQEDNSVIRGFGPLSDPSSVPDLSLEDIVDSQVPSSKRWVSRISENEGDDTLETSAVEYNRPPEESILYSSVLQVTRFLSEQEELVKDTAYMSESEKVDLMQKAFEPNYLVNPDPFVIDDKRLGYFFRTEYSFIDLPPLAEGSIPQEVTTKIENQALSEVLSFYNKPQEWLYEGEAHSTQNHRETFEPLLSGNPLVRFVDLRSPSLRPDDVYRAYLEFSRSKIDLIEIPTSSPSIDIPVADRAQEALDGLETQLRALYCADGASEAEAEARVQYDKYRAFAAKKKLEIARKLKSDLLEKAKKSQEVKDIQIDLGIFGQANLTDEQFLVGATDTLITGIKSAIGQNNKKTTGSKEMTITTRLLKRHIETVVENFKKTVKDFDNYELEGDPNFDVTVEAGRINQIMGELEAVFKRNKHARFVSSDSNKSLSVLFDHPETELTFYFGDNLDSSPSGSDIESLFVRNSNFNMSTDMLGIFTGTHGEEPKGILANNRTVNYLRNIRELAGISWENFLIPGYQGSVCDENDTTGGTGVAYVLKYTSGVSVAKSGGFVNPFHDYTKLASPSDAVNEFIDKTVDIKRSNKNILSSVAGVPSIEFTRSTILPMIGPYCTVEDVQTDFIKKFKLSALLCDYIKCLRLPDVNIKIPNLEPPEWPEIPTFKFPGLSKIWDDLQDLIAQIVRRVLCTLANAIMDVLRTPFCSDSLIEDLFGAGADQTASAAERALADALTDLGIPKDKYDGGQKLIEEATKLLTPREICALLKGEPVNSEVYEVLSRLSKMSTIDLEKEMDTQEKVANFFASLGIYIDPQLCESLGEYNKILGEYTCTDVSDQMSQIRRRISRNEETSEDDIQAALKLAEENLMNQAKALELFTNEGSLADIIPDLMDPESELSPLNKVPEAILETSDVVASAMFELPKISFMTSTRQYVPSMYLDSPSILGPDSINYDVEAANKSRRAIELLNLFSDFFKEGPDASNLDLNSPMTYLLYLQALCTDFEKPLDSASGVKTYVIIGEDSGDPAMRGRIDTSDGASKNIFDEINANLAEGDFSKFTDPNNALFEKVSNVTKDLFPIFLNTPVDLPKSLSEDQRKLYQSISGWKEYQYFKVYLLTEQRMEDEEKGDLIRSLQDKINSRLEILQSDITLNVDKLFEVSMGKELFKVIEDFYDIEAERRRAPTEKLIRYSDEADKQEIVITNPTNNQTGDYKVQVSLEQQGLIEDNYKYTVKIFDDFFFGALPGPSDSTNPETARYTFCEKINSNILGPLIDRSSQEEKFPAAALEYLLQVQVNQKHKAYNNNRNIQNWPTEDIKDSYYPMAIEGLTEQIASSVRRSRIFTDQQYIENLDSRVKGLRYLKPDGCIVNASGFSSLSILNFDELVTKRFREQFVKELASPLNSPLYRDFSLPGPTEKAIMNTAVLGFVRICMLEVLLKGAIPFSVWGASFVWTEQLFQKYLEDFVKTQIKQNGIFSESKVKELFDDTLVRLTGITNKEAAITRLISEEKSIIIDLATQIYDLEGQDDYTSIFKSEAFPFVNVPRIIDNPYPEIVITEPQLPSQPSAPNSDFESPEVNNLSNSSVKLLNSDITEDRYKSRSEKSITFFEKYIRLDGPVRMSNLTREDVAQAHTDGMNSLLTSPEGAPFRELVSDMSFSLPAGVFNYSDPQQIIAFWEEYNDSDANPELEVLSIPEFSDLMSKMLNSNPEIQRYFAELTDRIYSPEDTRTHMAPKCVDRAPVRKIVRRRGYFKFENEDLFSANRAQYHQPFGDDLPDHFRYSYGADYQDFIQTGIMPERSSVSHYRKKLKNAISQMDVTTYNGGSKERYYIIPSDTTSEEFLEASRLTDEDIQERTDFNEDNFPSPERVYQRMFGNKGPDEYDYANYSDRNVSIKEEFLKQRSIRMAPGKDGYRPLDPSAPWFTDLQPRQIDFIRDPETGDSLFQNRYGKVEKEYFDSVGSEEIEYWDETVIDLVFDAAPIFDSIGVNGLGRPLNEVQVEQNSLPLRAQSILPFITKNELESAQERNLAPDAMPSESVVEDRHVLAYLDDVTEGNGVYLLQGLSSEKQDSRAVDEANRGASNQRNIVDKKNDLTYSTFDMGSPQSLSPEGYKLGFKSKRLISNNEIALPVRIYLTQIKDVQGRITQTYFDYDIPSLAEFQTSNNDAFRQEVKVSISKLVNIYLRGLDRYATDVSDYMVNAGIRESSPSEENLAGALKYYNNRVNQESGNDNSSNQRIDALGVSLSIPQRYSDKLTAAFLSSVESNRSFPSFGGVRKDFTTTGPQATKDPLDPMSLSFTFSNDYFNFISANKIYSHALHSEVSEAKDNFEVNTAFFDQKFGKDPGALMRKPDLSRNAPPRVQNNTLDGTVDYASQYKKYYRHNQRTSQHDFYGNLSVFDVLERSAGSSTISNPIQMLTSDQPARDFIKSMGNLLMWTRQKRSDSVWGRTHGGYNFMFPGTTDGDYGRRASTEAHPFLCGPSMFHNDGRCMPHEYYAALRDLADKNNPVIISTDSDENDSALERSVEVLEDHFTALQILGSWPTSVPNDGMGEIELDRPPALEDTFSSFDTSANGMIAQIVRAFRNPKDTDRLNPLADLREGDNLTQFRQGVINFENLITFPSATLSSMGYSRHFFEFVDFDALDKYRTFTELIGSVDMSEERAAKRSSYESGVYDSVLPSNALIDTLPAFKKQGFLSKRMGRAINKYLMRSLFPERREQAVAILRSSSRAVNQLKSDYYTVLSSTLSSEDKSLMNYFFGVLFSDESGIGIKKIFEDTKIKVGARLMNSILFGEHQRLESARPVVDKINSSLDASMCLEERFGLQSFDLLSKALGASLDLSQAVIPINEFISLPIESVEKEIDYCTFYKLEDVNSFTENANAEAAANLDELLQTEKVKTYFDVPMPYKRVASMLTIHSTSMLAGYSQMPAVLTSTKSSLSAVFKMAAARDNFYNSDAISLNPNFNNVEIYNATNNFGSSNGPKLECFGGPDLGEWGKIIKEMIMEIIQYFPSYILRGIAEKIDPAYKEIKHHYMACNVDNFSFLDGGVLTALTVRDKEPVEFGASQRTNDYAPVNLAFPGDLAFSLARLFKLPSDRGRSLGETLLKLTNYAVTGPLPLFDASFAFEIPCRDFGGSKTLFDNWQKYVNDGLNRYGRYGHPAGVITALALSTAVIPGEREDKKTFCAEVIEENSTNRECEDEE